MSEPKRGYVVAERKSGKQVSKVVPSYEAAKELLRTIYDSTSDKMMICRVDYDDGTLHVPDLGDNSPG